MSAYNAVNYTPSSANPFLLTTLLRETFGFTGFVVSDCGAIDNIERQQHWQPAKNTVQKNNYAVKAGKTLMDYVNPETGVVTNCNGDCPRSAFEGPAHAVWHGRQAVPRQRSLPALHRRRPAGL